MHITFNAGNARIDLDTFKKFVPMHDWVFVKKWAPPEKTNAGIITIEDRNNFQCKRGTIVKIGAGSSRKPAPDIKIGDEIFFGATAGLEIPLPAGYLAMKASEILAVLEPDERDTTCRQKAKTGRTKTRTTAPKETPVQ